MKDTSIESSAAVGQVTALAVRPRSAVISVPWGPDGSLELTLPPDGSIAGADIDVVWPDLSGPLADYPGALEQALDSPVGTEKLEQHRGPGRKGGDRG